MIEYFKTEAMFTSIKMRTIFWLYLNSLVLAVSMSSCTVDPENRGLRAGVVKFIGKPIVKTTLVDTNLIVGDTIEVRYSDTLTQAVIIR